MYAKILVKEIKTFKEIKCVKGVRLHSPFISTAVKKVVEIQKYYFNIKTTVRSTNRSQPPTSLLLINFIVLIIVIYHDFW